MKKLLAVLLALALMLGACCAFAENVENPDLKNAASYLFMLYKNAKRSEPTATPADYTVLGVVAVDGVEYAVEWTADSETIKIVPNDDKTVTIDVDDKNPEEVNYVLTATVKDENGNTYPVSFERMVPAAFIMDAGMSYADIVDYIYTLQDGQATEETFRLFGTIVKIPTAWSEEYKNITVDIAVAGKEDMPVQCYRLSGEGADKLQVGDQITVEGIVKNYKGLIEFDKGCQLIGMGEIVSQKAIVEAAYAVQDGNAMPYPTALMGEIIRIPTAWSEEYKNITVDIVCDGLEEMPIQCYRLTGEGAADLKVGDVIGVFGTIKNYKGLIEFDKGCQLIPAESAKDVRTVLGAYNLQDGDAETTAKTLTGTIIRIPTAWSPDYKNITVDMEIAGLADYPIQCYRLSGEGADTLAEGDVITVTGTLKNYKGTIEFDKGCQLVAKAEAAAEEVAAEEPAVEEPVAEEPAVEEPAAEAEEEFTPVLAATIGEAILRSGPATSYEILDVLEYQQLLVAQEVVPGEDGTGDWYKVWYKGLDGYIAAGMMELWD